MKSPKLEPEVLHATTVARKVFPLLKPIKVIDEKVLNRGRIFREAKVDRDSSATLFIRLSSQPVSDVSALRTEVKFKGLARHVVRRLTRGLDFDIDMPIGPEGSVTPT